MERSRAESNETNNVGPTILSYVHRRLFTYSAVELVAKNFSVATAANLFVTDDSRECDRFSGDGATILSFVEILLSLTTEQIIKLVRRRPCKNNKTVLRHL